MVRVSLGWFSSLNRESSSLVVCVQALFLLFETAAGYGLFERTEGEEIAALLEQGQESFTDLGRFSKIVKLKAFFPFSASEEALINQNDVSDGRAYWPLGGACRRVSGTCFRLQAW